MRKAYKIDEYEYKKAQKEGATALINKTFEPKNAEVYEVDGTYWLAFDTDYPHARNDWQE